MRTHPDLGGRLSVCRAARTDARVARIARIDAALGVASGARAHHNITNSASSGTFFASGPQWSSVSSGIATAAVAV
jgi:hypothetical protein